MNRYRLSRAANDDLFDVFVQGLDQFGPRQAERYRDAIRRTFDRLADFPEMGRARPDVGPTVRTLPFKAHVVVYRRDGDDGVLILRVRHAREDWLDDPMGELDDE